MEQFIISVGREFGSGGRLIAEELAKRFEVPVYNRHLITKIAEKTGLDPEDIEKYNENPRTKLLSRTVRGYSNSIEDNIAEMQFNFIREKANSGESFVVLGRCSETKLKGHPALISLFVLADMDAKIKRIMQLYELSEDKAKALIDKKDRKRKRYHNYHCSGHWGDSRLYDLSINSSRLGIERTIDCLEQYIRARIAK